MDGRRHYYRSYCFTSLDMFANINPTKWNVPNIFRWGYGEIKAKRAFCGMVLTYFFFLVLCDIIENNITFEFPLIGDKHAYLYVKCFSGDDFNRLFAGGKFLGIDFLSSEFKGYQIFFQWQKGKFFREKPVYISCNLKNWFYSKINSGKQYY